MNIITFIIILFSIGTFLIACYFLEEKHPIFRFFVRIHSWSALLPTDKRRVLIWALFYYGGAILLVLFQFSNQTFNLHNKQMFDLSKLFIMVIFLFWCLIFLYSLHRKGTIHNWAEFYTHKQKRIITIISFVFLLIFSILVILAFCPP